MLKLEEELNKKEKYTWPARLDSIAEELCYFQQNDRFYVNERFDVDINDIQFEFGAYYKKGFEDLVTNYDNIEKIDSEYIGHLEKELNRLNIYVNSDRSKINNFGKAIEAAINKILIESGVQSQISLPMSNISSYEAAIEILSNKKITDNIDILLKKIKRPGIFIREIEKPVMVTELWEHQRDALGKWLGNDCIGYVNMATATGKTVLGISAMASLYGNLHPVDKDLEQTIPGGDVLIVANTKLVLEQWKRELDEHLEIPPEITGLKGENEVNSIKLNWGTIDFVYFDELNDLNKKYDLVILDEVHSYPDRIEVFKKDILSKKIKLLALSGSIDSSKSDRRKIENRLNQHLKNIKTYTLNEAREDGIIPEFSWNVIYTGYEDVDEKLIESTSQCKKLFNKFSKSDDEEYSSLDCFDEFRTFSQTKRGMELKEKDLEFENFTSQLFSRRTRIWNQVPKMSAIEHFLKKYIVSRKCLILVNSIEQVQELEKRFKRDVKIKNEIIWAIKGNESAIKQRDIIDDFDQKGNPGVLIGTRNNLGVGVDIKGLEVVLNMSRGRLVNKSLIQYMGRMLRASEDKKKPVFLHFVGIPTKKEFRIPNEDGEKILKGLSQYLAWGDKIESRPEFSVYPDEVEDELRLLEKEGRNLIEKLESKNKYSWPILGINKKYGPDKMDKKDAKTYLKEEIVNSELPDQGSLILKKFGKKESKVKMIDDQEKYKDLKSLNLDNTGITIKDFKVKKEEDETYFEIEIRGPIDWLIKGLENFDIINKIGASEILSDNKKDTSDEDEESYEVEEYTPEEDKIDELFEEKEMEEISLNLSSIQNSDIEVENIYLINDVNETFYPLDDDGKTMSKQKLKETDFSKIENLSLEFRIPEGNYKLAIVTKYDEIKKNLGKLPKD